jgi:hypothetical protein
VHSREYDSRLTLNVRAIGPCKRRECILEEEEREDREEETRKQAEYERARARSAFVPAVASRHTTGRARVERFNPLVLQHVRMLVR